MDEISIPQSLPGAASTYLSFARLTYISEQLSAFSTLEYNWLDATMEILRKDYKKIYWLNTTMDILRKDYIKR